MRVKDWYNFNFCNEQFGCAVEEICIRVFRTAACSKDDKIFWQLVHPADAVMLFGDYVLTNVCMFRPDGKRFSLCIDIYKETQASEAGG